jgi:hypothetical protein
MEPIFQEWLKNSGKQTEILTTKLKAERGYFKYLNMLMKIAIGKRKI